MGQLEKALITIRNMETRSAETTAVVGAVSMTLSVVLFIGILLSIPLTNIRAMLLMALWLAVGAPWLGISFTSLIKRSLIILPFIALIGIFNPIIDRQPAAIIYGITISYGWITFIGIILRGLMCVQAVLLLIEEAGFRGICLSLSRLGVPRFLTNQLLMVYRYINVLLEEALTMNRARRSRAYGRDKMPLGMWGPFVGQLFLRSVSRAERIHQAMLSRGFNGEIPVMYFQQQKWGRSDSIWLATSAIVFIAIRIWG